MLKSENESQKKLGFYARPLFINFLLLVINLVLFTLKLNFSFLSGSIALQADAFDSITDVIMVCTGLIGIIFAAKKPNDRFPYGYYRIENVIGVVIAMFIFFTAYNIIMESIGIIQGFFLGLIHIIIITPEVLIFLFISLGISVFLTLYLIYVGKKSQSFIIQSEAKEKIFDIFISVSVIFNFICALFHIYILDAIVGLAIACFIIKGGYDIFQNSTRTLIDAVIDYENRVELEDFIQKNPLIRTVKSIQIRGYGKYIVIEAEFTLRKDLPLSQIDQFKRKLEHDAKQRFPNIFKVILLIHSEEKKVTKIAVPLDTNQGRKSKICQHFGESPNFALLEIRDGNLLSMSILENPFLKEERRKGILVSEWLISQKIDKLHLKKALQKGPKLVFNSRLTELVITDLETLNEVISSEIKKG